MSLAVVPERNTCAEVEGVIKIIELIIMLVDVTVVLTGAKISEGLVRAKIEEEKECDD